MACSRKLSIYSSFHRLARPELPPAHNLWIRGLGEGEPVPGTTQPTSMDSWLLRLVRHLKMRTRPETCAPLPSPTLKQQLEPLVNYKRINQFNIYTNQFWGLIINAKKTVIFLKTCIHECASVY